MGKDLAKDLVLEIHLDEAGGLPTAAFVAIAKWLDLLAHEVSQTEFQKFLSVLDLHEKERLDAMREMNRRRRWQASPAEIKEIHRGSWIIVATVSSGVLLWTWKNLLGPTVKDAWDGSTVQDKLRRFLQDELFGGAKDLVEKEAAQMSPTEVIQVIDIDESHVQSSTPRLKIKMTKRRVIGVRSPNQKEIDQMMRKLRGE